MKRVNKYSPQVSFLGFVHHSESQFYFLHTFIIVSLIFRMPSFGTFSFAMLAWSAFFATSTLAASDNSTKVPLRIMALGASVSFGIGSTTGNSYRKDLEDLLVKDGDTVEYVGSEKHGDFSDNAVEAVPGFVIAQIAASASISVSVDSERASRLKH